MGGGRRDSGAASSSRSRGSKHREQQEEDYEHVSPPWNFSWVVEGEVCGSSWPESAPNIAFLRSEGVGVIVSLSEERLPHRSALKCMDCYMIPVEEFEAPTMEQIAQFIEICDNARKGKKAVCVHCRMGRGRTGVMLACYLIKYHSKAPDAAILDVRFKRPGSIETREQERAVKNFRDYLDWGHL